MPKPSQVLADRYVLGNVIASGGMAEVWQARDDVLARTVAVKILRADLTTDPTFVERFKREALSAARLTHPHIVAIYDTGSDEADGVELHYIVMEHCGGGTLRTLLGASPMSPERVISAIAPVADALTYAHSQGIVHRDMKPENVLVSDQSTLKVADFGIAKAAFSSGDITTTGTIIGTVTYISPEQANGLEPGPRSDIYSLGVLVYEALVGRPPFKEESDVATALAHVNSAPPPLRSIKAGVPRALDEVVLKALAKDPEDRYSSATEMQAALEATLDSGSTQVLRVPQRRPAARREETTQGSGRKGMWIALGVLLLGLVILIAALNAGDEPGDGGGPGGSGNETEQSDGGGGATNIEVSSVTDFDPHGDGEHPESVNLTIDEDPGSSWSSETYRSTLTLIKPGVGLVFDLGDTTEVTEVVVDLDNAGYNLELRAGDEAGADEAAFEVVESVEGSESTVRFQFDPVSARHWLVWITGLPGGGGGQASIAEVKFIGP
jgi:serine/threonine protein kinase